MLLHQANIGEGEKWQAERNGRDLLKDQIERRAWPLEQKKGYKSFLMETIEAKVDEKRESAPRKDSSGGGYSHADSTEREQARKSPGHNTFDQQKQSGGVMKEGGSSGSSIVLQQEGEGYMLEEDN